MLNIFLIVEDFLSEILFKKFLKFYNFKVIGSALTGEVALNLLVEMNPKPEIILFAYSWLFEKEIEITKKMVNMCHQSKVIVLTTFIKIKEQVLDVGAFNVIEVPFKMKELAAVIFSSMKQNEYVFL